MSRKRKSRPGGGNIQFVGLRYFLALSEGRVSRKELVELIRRFFTSRGLEVPDNLVVEFRMTRRPTVLQGVRKVPINGMYRTSMGAVVVYVRGKSFVQVLQTLHHELDHAAWWLEKGYFNTHAAYRRQAHEIRAFSHEGRWDLLAERPVL